MGTAHKAHVTKRLGSEELIHEWDSKRVNLGNLQSYPGYEQMVGAGGEPKTGYYAPHPSAISSSVTWQTPMQFSFQATGPNLFGKGQSNGVMEIGCASIATIIIMHLNQNAVGLLNTISSPRL